MARLSLAAVRRAVRRLFCARASTAGDAADDAATAAANHASRTSTSTPSAAARLEHRSPVRLEHRPARRLARSSSSSSSSSTGSSTAMGNSRADHADKENVPPTADGVAAALEALSLGSGGGPGSGSRAGAACVALVEDPRAAREREQNLRFIGEALEMARLALRTNETPVGCVLVHRGSIIAKGMNATNVTRNGTRHAELMAISALLSVPSETPPRVTSLKPKQLMLQQMGLDASSDASSDGLRPPDQGNEDGSKSHLFPYGQKFLTDKHVDASILRETTLYVTVEPCVMCASLLRQFGIKKVYFGAVNDKFGGTGGVFSIHANSLPVGADGSSAAAHPLPRRQPAQLPDGSGTLGLSYPPGGGDGGNVEPGYEIEGGWGRDEAVGLLRRFYVQENGRAPVPRKKEGRAARLAAMMEKDGSASSASLGDAALLGLSGHGSSSSSLRSDSKENAKPRAADGSKSDSSSRDENDDEDDDDNDDADDDYLGLMEGQLRRGDFATGGFAL